MILYDQTKNIYFFNTIVVLPCCYMLFNKKRFWCSTMQQRTWQ